MIGTVGCAPYRKDLLAGTCTRYYRISHLIQVDCGYPVVIRLVPAAFAGKQMLPFVPVGSFRMPATGAPLTGIRSQHFNNQLLVVLSFVDQFLLQVIIGPADRNVAVFPLNPLGCGPDTGQIFQNKHRIFRIGLNECLTDAVVEIPHPTVFSFSDLL